MMTKERESEISKIINGISRGYGSKRVFSMDTEDLSQQLWVIILNEEQKKQKELDFNLIARICYMAINYIARSDCRKPRVDSLDYNWNSVFDDNKTNYFEQCDKKSGTIPIKEDEDLTHKILIKDLLNYFPLGSKERTYIDFWASYIGIRDTYRPVDSNKYKDGFSENRLAIELGFPGTGSASYKKFRNNMRKFISKFLGLDS